MKCQNQNNNKYCKGKADKGVIANKMRVCLSCYYKLKRINKEKGKGI